MKIYILFLLAVFSCSIKHYHSKSQYLLLEGKNTMLHKDPSDRPVQLSRDEFLTYNKSGIIPDTEFEKKYGVKVYLLPDKKVILENQGQYLLFPSLDFVLRTFQGYEESFIQDHNREEVNKSSPKSLIEKEPSFFVFDSLGQRHAIPNISPQEFEEFQKKGLKEHKEYFDQYGMNVYETKDGEIIIEANMLYCIYPSFNLFYDVLKNPERRSIMASLHEKNFYNEEFPNHVDFLVTTLLKDFGVLAKGKTDAEIIADIDRVIHEKRTVAFFDQHFLSFVALVGSSILKHYNGHWEMILAQDKQTWTPYLVINNLRVFFVDYIKEDLFNLHQEEPLREVFETIEAIVKTNKNDRER